MEEKKIKEVEVEKQEPKKTIAPKKNIIPSKVNIMFRETRKFDLHIGRNMITFRGRETKPVPKEWTDHKDFKPVESLFVIKGA